VPTEILVIVRLAPPSSVSAAELTSPMLPPVGSKRICLLQPQTTRTGIGSPSVSRTGSPLLSTWKSVVANGDGPNEVIVPVPLMMT
jgi:hypothetical protein